MNNFDQSSSGVNLDLICCFDSDISQINFKEDYLSDSSIPDLWHYISCGTFDETDVTDINNYSDVTKQTLIAAFKDYSVLNCFSSENMFEHYCDSSGISIRNVTKNSMIEYLYENFNPSDMLNFCHKYFTPKFYIAEATGHCQGDYFRCIIPEQAIAECPTMTPEKWDDMIYKACFCSPLYIRLNIDDEEFYFDSYLSDSYNYDKAEIMSIAEKHIEHEQKAYILQWLDNALPEYPEYQ